MSKSNHTPGPWHIVGECIMDGSIEVICGDPKLPAYVWEFVASVHYETDKGEDANTFSKEIGEANARLIAAAPDLLEALQVMLEEPWLLDSSRPKHWAQEQARAAIEKATKEA